MSEVLIIIIKIEHRDPYWIFLKGPTVYTHIQRFRNVEKWKDEERIQQTNSPQKAGIAILIANKIKFEITKDKEGHILTDWEICLS